jgi:hypothetical protein
LLSRPELKYLILGMIGLAALVHVFVKPFAFEGTSTDKVDGFIKFNREITLRVGESAVIHGYRGNCGRPAPSVPDTAALLPQNLAIGQLSVGTVGVRYSRQCEGVTPARRIIFTANKTGTQAVRLLGDDLTIAVTPP